jgi:gliding motility-associated-like protein
VKRTLSVILLFIASLHLSALHIVGGDITYEYLGNDQYLVTLKVYRDCNSINGAPFDIPATVGVFNSQNVLVQTISMSGLQITNIPPVISNPCLAAPPNVCVEEGVYSEIVTLPAIPGGYTLAYQRCCRNVTIDNLLLPGDQGATYFTSIPNHSNLQNSSPVFNDFPPIAICTGDQLSFDHSATDLDGDSLVYSFTSPFTGGTSMMPMPVPPANPPYNTVNFGAGYSAQNAIPGNPAFAINPTTGLLTGTANQIGQYVMGVLVEEYRNGVKIGETFRDFQFNVVSCFANTQALIDPQDLFCAGLTYTFDNFSNTAQFYLWDFGVPNITTDTSSQTNPTYTFPDTGTYTVTLIANPGWPCSDTIQRDFRIYNSIPPNINSPPNQCITNNSFDFEVLSNHSETADYLWDFGNGTSSTAEDPLPITYAAPGDYIVSVTVSEFGCQFTDTDTVTVFPIPTFNVAVDTVEGCAPFTFEMEVTSNYPESVVDYLWSFGPGGGTSSGASIIHTIDQPGVYDLTLSAITTDGCIESSVFTFDDVVIVDPTPVAGFSTSDSSLSIWDAYVWVYNESTGFDSVSIDMGDGTVYINRTQLEHNYTWDGDYDITMIAVGENGCADTLVRTIEVVPEFIPYIPNAFTPGNDDGVNEFFRPQIMGTLEYEFWVFNRWGEELFYTINPREGWDGTHRGKMSQQGVYLYRVNVLTVDRERKIYQGTFSLIR